MSANPGTSARRLSLDLEDNLSANVSTGRTLVRFLRIRQVVLAVDPDTYRSLIEQAFEFCQLRTTRTDLGGRDRDSELFSLFGAVESQPEDGEQRSTTLERAQEASRGRTANRVHDQIDVADGFFGLALGVVDELVRTELAQERLMLAR